MYEQKLKGKVRIHVVLMFLELRGKRSVTWWCGLKSTFE